MLAEEFHGLLEQLTGTPVKPLTTTEVSFLSEALRNDDLTIGVSQFNELLLLANKDRLTAPFFAFFFCTDASCNHGQNETHVHSCTISEIPNGVRRFQTFALLVFGNFIYAYRELSPVSNMKALQGKLGEYCREPAAVKRELETRPAKMLRINPIPRDETRFIGYMSTRVLTAERQRVQWIRASGKSSAELQHDLETATLPPDEKKERLELLQRLEAHAKIRGSSVEEVMETAYKALVREEHAVDEARSRAKANTEVYLTWDYMDLYFATSMRRRWEFEDLHTLVSQLPFDEAIRNIHLRYFDPTQSFEDNRINKGLVEALMLKRAACTVYSVQETDTLGKDSELAATLAQGKPVIAYAPEYDVSERVEALIMRPADLDERLDFVCRTDPGVESELGMPAISAALLAYRSTLDTYRDAWPWEAIDDPDQSEHFASCASEVRVIATVIAEAENRIYLARAATLRDAHPLALQVNLATGVANGVLVARTVHQCAELIRDILTNSLEFDVEEDCKADAWVLRERRSGCIFRVVTRNRKLTNCFWNFYRRT